MELNKQYFPIMQQNVQIITTFNILQKYFKRIKHFGKNINCSIMFYIMIVNYI